MGKFLRSSIVRFAKTLQKGVALPLSVSLSPSLTKREKLPLRVHACMHGRDTRPLYERYLMDCIGRAQTLNLTFTIIAALRGGAARIRDTGGWRNTRGRERGWDDVNFIILAKKLRPSESTESGSLFLLASPSPRFYTLQPLLRHSARRFVTFYSWISWQRHE